jgi:Zn-finger nucleic acid-binding protein
VSSLVANAGALGEAVCPTCGGRFLHQQLAEQILTTELGMTPAFLRELSEQYAGGIGSCPGCKAAMKAVRVRGVTLDLCFTCGGCWLDARELTALTAGLHPELKAPKAAVATLPLPPVAEEEDTGTSTTAWAANQALVLAVLGAPAAVPASLLALLLVFLTVPHGAADREPFMFYAFSLVTNLFALGGLWRARRARSQALEHGRGNTRARLAQGLALLDVALTLVVTDWLLNLKFRW